MDMVKFKATREVRNTMYEIKELIDKWLCFVDDFGNECAYSDAIIEEIQEKAALLYDKEQGNS